MEREAALKEIKRIYNNYPTSNFLKEIEELFTKNVFSQEDIFWLLDSKNLKGIVSKRCKSDLIRKIAETQPIDSLEDFEVVFRKLKTGITDQEVFNTLLRNFRYQSTKIKFTKLLKESYEFVDENIFICYTSVSKWSSSPLSTSTLSIVTVNRIRLDFFKDCLNYKFYKLLVDLRDIAAICQISQGYYYLKLKGYKILEKDFKVWRCMPSEKGLKSYI